jgi:stearoyl-CoA desaturase (Delta-9 desaturase)
MEKWLKNLSPPVNFPHRDEMSLWQKYDFKQIAIFISMPFLVFFSFRYHIRAEAHHFELLILGLFLSFLGILCTAAGYHRYYSHKSFEASKGLKLFFLFFGPSALQNSAIKWANDHRRHHKYSEKKEDPYPIFKGFFYAHFFWPMDSEKKRYRTNMVKDLLKDPLALWQHQNYKYLAFVHTIVFPPLIGYFLFDSPVGGFLFLGVIKVFLIQQSSSCINSIGHKFGSRTHDPDSSATDSFFNGLLTFGEGYHNYHHKYPNDFRHGHKWYHWEPTKWFIQAMGLLGQARDLKTVDHGKAK